MKIIQILAAVLLIQNVACGKLPESKRSKEVVGRVSSQLVESMSAEGHTLGNPIFMRIFKESNELEVWVQKGSSFELYKTYEIHYFSGNIGPKLKEGDMQAPEGFYYVTPSRMNPNSSYHLSFNLGYPNTYDRAHHRTGSALMVHGSTVSIGCFAMTDPRIEEIYTLAHSSLLSGQKFFRVHIFPFRMTPEKMKQHHSSEWINFWNNLKEGYDFFEQYGSPPNVEVYGKRYVFEIDNN
ncbi:MAG: L,D-transpeptidase family protein [Opitutaceae bacterium]